jgi:hypothetical protein
VPSYLEIALRVAPSVNAKREQQPACPAPERVLRASESIAEAEQSSASAACESPHCAGCYEVARGVRIHPPKCGNDYRRWVN